MGEEHNLYRQSVNIINFSTKLQQSNERFAETHKLQQSKQKLQDNNIIFDSQASAAIALQQKNQQDDFFVTPNDGWGWQDERSEDFSLDDSSDDEIYSAVDDFSLDTLDQQTITFTPASHTFKQVENNVVSLTFQQDTAKSNLFQVDDTEISAADNVMNAVDANILEDTQVKVFLASKMDTQLYKVTTNVVNNVIEQNATQLNKSEQEAKQILTTAASKQAPINLETEKSAPQAIRPQISSQPTRNIFQRFNAGVWQLRSVAKHFVDSLAIAFNRLGQTIIGLRHNKYNTRIGRTIKNKNQQLVDEFAVLNSRYQQANQYYHGASKQNDSDKQNYLNVINDVSNKLLILEQKNLPSQLKSQLSHLGTNLALEAQEMEVSLQEPNIMHQHNNNKLTNNRHMKFSKNAKTHADEQQIAKSTIEPAMPSVKADQQVTMTP